MPDITEITDESFGAAVLRADKPVLVDFHAPWSRACHLLDPVLQQLADEYGDALQIAKVDVEQNRQTTMAFDVLATPTLILFIDGRPITRIVGAYGHAQLLAELESSFTGRDRSPAVAAPQA